MYRFNERKKDVRDYLETLRTSQANMRRDRREVDSRRSRVLRISIRGYPRLSTDPTEGEREAYVDRLEARLRSECDEAGLSHVDMQNALERQRQTMQTISNTSKMMHDTPMGVIRRIG